MKRYMPPFLSKLCFFWLFIATFAFASSAPQVFQLSTGSLSPEGIQLNWKMMEGAYLYKKFIKVDSLSPNVQIGTPIFPKGDIKDTQLFGKVVVYHDSLSLNVPIENPTHQSSIQLKLSYQGCSERGQCFPPITQILNIDLKIQSPPGIIDTHPEMQTSQKTSTIKTLPELTSIAQSFESNSLAWLLAGFFVLGLALSVTPCVLPMIPILSSIIVYGHNPNGTSKIKAFSLSFAYVLGMSCAYAVLGFLMSIVGSKVQTFFQNPYIILLFSLLFIFLALSLLGFFEVRWSIISSNKLSQFNQRLAQKACKNHFTVMGMGFLSALIVSPCITPPLIGALSYIATTGNISLGTSALFCMGLGLGLPLLFIGALSNTLLPKAGKWMDIIKCFMGIILFGVAFFMIQRLLPHHAYLLWSIFALIASIILLYRIDFQTYGRRFIFQALCFVGIVGSGLNIIHHVFTSPSETQNYISVFTSMQLNHYLTLAKKEHKPVIIDFYADWCPDCQLMETRVFNHPQVIQSLKKFMWIKIDMTNDSPEIWAIQEQYGISGPPTFLFYGADGSALKEFNFVGLKSEQSFLEILKRIESQRIFKKLGET